MAVTHYRATYHDPRGNVGGPFCVQEKFQEIQSQTVEGKVFGKTGFMGYTEHAALRLIHTWNRLAQGRITYQLTAGY